MAYNSRCMFTRLAVGKCGPLHSHKCCFDTNVSFKDYWRQTGLRTVHVVQHQVKLGLRQLVLMLNKITLGQFLRHIKETRAQSKRFHDCKSVVSAQK